jgi:hypothetical protein
VNVVIFKNIFVEKHLAFLIPNTGACIIPKIDYILGSQENRHFFALKSRFH